MKKIKSLYVLPFKIDASLHNFNEEKIKVYTIRDKTSSTEGSITVWGEYERAKKVCTALNRAFKKKPKKKLTARAARDFLVEAGFVISRTGKLIKHYR